MDRRRYDFLVIGSGLAGLTFALTAAESGASVAVLTKGEITESNTSWAQGGIAAAVGEADSWELHERDTLIAGAGLCDEAAVRHLVREAPAAIEWLKTMGTRFDKELGREGGHSRNRILHHADKTGWEIERAVSETVEHTGSIRVFPHAFVTSLLMDGGRVTGAIADIDDLGPVPFLARAVMLATGGAGKMYQHTTNPRVATADGIGLASAVGADIRDMEFMQFHPTTLYHDHARSFLITEAVRGAGGTLRNHLGRRFMWDYDERLELAPRDIVARAIEAEIKKHATWCVYLDMTHLDPERIRHEFPTIVNKLGELGIDAIKEWIPVVPAQHYSCGGVVTDLDGQTSIPGLYAAGEVSRTGVHGANRLASNSLLEAIVFAKAAAHKAADEPLPTDGEIVSRPPRMAESEAIRIRRALQKTMMRNVGIVRSNAGLDEAERDVARLTEEASQATPAAFSPYAAEAGNLLVAARYVVEGARARKVNVGLHYNVDQLPNAGAAIAGNGDPNVTPASTGPAAVGT